VAQALTLIDVVKAVQRIPVELRGKTTFFSRHDTWIYHGVFDEVFCEQCQAKAVPYTYAGSSLRREFPWLEISDVNRVEALVHPNCRCWLERSVLHRIDTYLGVPELSLDVAPELMGGSLEQL
jgi:hypothetical protein